jgi:hypothetical protein
VVISSPMMISVFFGVTITFAMMILISGPDTAGEYANCRKQNAGPGQW